MNSGIKELIIRIQADEQMLAEGCVHLKEIQQVTPSSTRGCEECLALGVDTWIRLRICLTCGYIGCCDNSRYQHARKHYNETGHPMILSFEPNELWMYCFADDEIYIAPE
jgi:uncharacterized UBP type Zn finger protein